MPLKRAAGHPWLTAFDWLGWPSAVTADGLMHTGLDEATVLSHARAWEAR